MKRAISISILIVIIFAVVVILTAKMERLVDGNDVYGYPLVFLTEYGGLVADRGFKPSSFNFLNLIIDLLPVTVVNDLRRLAVLAI
jgi:hypothetical protein